MTAAHPSAARTWAPWLLLAAASLLAGALDATVTGLLPYDEGWVLTDAHRLAMGEVPHRDFSPPPYGPLEAVTIAPFVAAIGPELLLLRAVRVLAGTLLVVSIGLYLARLGTPALAALAMAVVVAHWPAIFHSAFGALLAHAAAALWAFQAPDGPGRARRLVFAGLLVCLTALLRYDFGALGLIATSAALIVQRATSFDLAPRDRARAAARDLGLLALGAAPTILVYALLAVLAAGTFAVPLAEGAGGDARRLPFPLWLTAGRWGLVRGIYYVWAAPLAVVLGLGAIGTAAWRAWRARSTSPHLVALVQLQVLLLGLCVYARARTDVPHVFPAFAVGTVVLAAVLSGTQVELPRPPVARWAAAGLLLLVLGLRTVEGLERRAAHPANDVPGLRGLRLEPEATRDLARVLRVLDSLMGLDEPVFIGCQSHARLTWNDALLYSLARRPVPTRFHGLDPLHTPTESVQRLIIAELERAHVRVVVLRQGTWWPEPNASAIAGSTLLDDWIAAHFTLHERVGKSYVVLVRR